MPKAKTILFATAAILLAAPAFAGSGMSPKAGGPEGNPAQHATEPVGPTTKNGDATTVGGNAKPGEIKGSASSGEATTASTPSSRGGK